MVSRVVAWYTGNRRYDSGAVPSPSAWAAAALPDDGALAFMLLAEDGTGRIMQGNDIYFCVPAEHPDGEVWGHNDETPEEVRSRYGVDTLVFRGQWTSDAEMRAVLDEIREMIEGGG